LSNNFVKKLAKDTGFPLDRKGIKEVIDGLGHGEAVKQITAVSERIGKVIASVGHKRAAEYHSQPTR
jgi:hypothetical protein